MKLTKKETEELNTYLQKLLDDRIAQCDKLEVENATLTQSLRIASEKNEALKAKAAESVAELRRLKAEADESSTGSVNPLFHYGEESGFEIAADLVAEKFELTP